MQICLISGDEKLQNLVSEMAGPKFCTVPPGQEPPESDVYLWDVIEGFVLSSSTHGRHLFMVDRQQLASLAQQLGEQSPVSC